MLAPAFAVGWWTILFWIFVGVAIGGLIAWLLGRSATATTAGSNHLASLDGKRAVVKAEFTHPVDQLEAIEGVGPQIAALFHKNGIHRFAQIADMTPEAINKILAAGGSAYAIAQPHTWPFQARLLANNNLAEFLTVGQYLKAGRLPLTGLAGVGDATAQRLAAADIGSVEALAVSDPEAVSAKLAAVGDSVAPARISEWVAEAKSILAGDHTRLATFFGLPAAALAARKGETWTETREVSGPLVNAHALVGETVVTETKGPSLLPFWLGLIGAILLSLLCMLKIWCPWTPKVEAPVVAVAPPAPEPLAAPEGAGVRTEERDGKPLLVVFFAVDKRDVSNELAAESAKLKDYLDTHPDARLSVSGYHDPSGGVAYNAELAKNRAENVAAALAAAGIARDRVDLDKPSETSPGESSYAADRKVEVSIKEAGQEGAKPAAHVEPPAGTN